MTPGTAKRTTKRQRQLQEREKLRLAAERRTRSVARSSSRVTRLLVFAAVSVVHLVSMEVLRGTVPSFPSFVATIGKFTMVAMVGMEVIVHVAAEVGGSMKPWAGTDEDAAGEPLGAIVAVGSALVGRGFVVSIGTGRGWSDVDADLSFGFGSICYET
jgi:hypothetical protein